MNNLYQKLNKKLDALTNQTGTKHKRSDFKCFSVKFYVSALFGVIIKVTPHRNSPPID